MVQKLQNFYLGALLPEIIIDSRRTKNRPVRWGALELRSKYGQVKRVIILLINLLPNCGQDLKR
jgi:hypothetical protein